jgi:SAM-dependent methyltransferase
MATQTDEQMDDLAFTGERFMPEIAGQIAFEHLHRYHFAARFCAGKRVLDVACGEGYGSQILSVVAEDVTGIDISADAVAHAAGRYGTERLKFVEASAALLPLDDDSVDVVVSFETIEHHDQHEEMLSEIRRVLRPGGLMVLSSPNKQFYSIEPGYSNPYHVKELFRHELVALVGRYFAHQQVYSQRVVYGSLLVSDANAKFDSILGTGPDTCQWSDGLSRPLYDLVIASDSALPEQETTFFEQKVHGLDAGTFYGVHLPERVQNADVEVLRLQSQVAELQEEVREQANGQRLVLSGAEDELRRTGEVHLDDIERLRDSRNEVLSALSVLGALVDDVRREGSHERLAQERRLESLQDAFERNQALLAQATVTQATDIGQLGGQLSGQLTELRVQLKEAVASEERIRGLERMLAESQEMVLNHINSAGQLRQDLAATLSQRDSLLQEVQSLQISVTELRLNGEHREKEVEDLRSSRSWRYTAWLRKLSGSARGRS